jgi:peptidase M28-like protein/PA domain-containing protein
MRSRSFLQFALGALLVCSAAAGQELGFDADRYLGYVKHLSSDEMKGRGTAAPELEAAAEYIAEQFKSFGLKAPDGSYYQRFQVATKAKLGRGNRLEYTLDGEEHSLKLRREYLPMKLSGRGRVRGSVVFAGYGISAAEYGYDDYAGLDARGKIVMILRHEPQEYDRKSIFAGRVYTEHSQLFSKVLNAHEHGAKAVLLVNDSEQHGGSSGDLTDFDEYPGAVGAGIPFVHLDADVATKWFKAAGKDYTKTQRTVNEELRPVSFEFPPTLSVTIRSDVQRQLRTVRNVMAYLPGTTDEYVVIGAHYDHIGHGEQYSMAPNSSGTLHPGADDNASGTGGLIELARWFSSQPQLRRGVLFLAFSAEELGLVGSGHYVRHPMLPIADAVAMVNLDMIGRMRDQKVYVGGVQTGTGFQEILEQSLAGRNIEIDVSETVGYGSSDHTSFSAREVPALFFFSGLHGDYHRPGDTWDKIKPQETVQLLSYIASVVNTLASNEQRPAFVRPLVLVPGTH